MIHPQRSLLRSVAIVACAGAMATLTGCAGRRADSPAANVRSLADTPKFANQLGSAAGESPAGPAGAAAGNPARMRVVQLDVYQLVIPRGAVSRSEEFWKHVDEQQIDVGTYDLLRKNGWRTGVAPTAEWNYFRDIIDAYPASSKPHAVSAGPGGGGSMELSMKKDVPYQNIFYFSDANALFGRTFEECENFVSLTLQQVPRNPGAARVTVCPTVRGLRRRFEVSNAETGREIKYVHPERLYDMNLQVDVPINHFLVIAPSPEVRWKTSLGATFLIQDGTAEQLENVLLIVPRAAELEQVAPAARAPAPAR